MSDAICKETGVRNNHTRGQLNKQSYIFQSQGTKSETQISKPYKVETKRKRLILVRQQIEKTKAN